MGLDDSVERSYFDSLGTGISYDEFCKLYSDNFGKIDCIKAFFLAKDVEKPRGIVRWGIERVSTKEGIENGALNTFKALAVMLHKIKKVDCDPKGLENILYRMNDSRLMNKAKYSREDFDGLFSSAAHYFAGLPPHSGKKFWLPLFGGNLLPNGIKVSSNGKTHDYLHVGGSTVLGEVQFKRKILDFNKRMDFELYTDACEYIESLIDYVDIDIKHKMAPENQTFRGHLNRLLGSLTEEIKINSTKNSPFTFLCLDTFLNNQSRVPSNDINCCIAGPSGESKEASFLNLLDSAVNTWHFCVQSPYREKIPTFGLGIFVEVTGKNVSMSEPTKYLVMEGFPSNQEFYSGISELREPSIATFRSKIRKMNFPRGMSLAQSVYCLGLFTAKDLGITKLFINTEHKGAQKSVEHTVREIAKLYGVPRDCWEFTKHREFKLTGDPVNGNFQALEYGGKKFEYTHFLEKPSLSAKIVEQVGRDPSWKGEGFFDTWYAWNKFIMDTYDNWSPEEKARHPYAEIVAKRGKDPQWNLGIGYCKGFEVDVEKECKRLHIS